MESPAVADIAHTPMLAYSSGGSCCDSPLQHTPTSASGLDIVASLDLVNVAETGADFDYSMISPSLYPEIPKSEPSHAMMGYPASMGGASHAYLPVTSPMMPDGSGYSQDYSQYDFELHQLMSDPSELLTKCVCKDKETKPSLSQLQAHTT